MRDALVTYKGGEAYPAQLTKTGSGSFDYPPGVDTVDVVDGYTLTVYEKNNQTGKSTTIEGPVKDKKLPFEAHGWKLKRSSIAGGAADEAKELKDKAKDVWESASREEKRLYAFALVLFLVWLIS